MAERTPALDEQETTFAIEATNRNTMYIYTNDTVWLARLEKLGITPTAETAYGKSYKLDLNDFTFTLRRKRKLSNNERKALVERLSAAREKSSEA